MRRGQADERELRTGAKVSTTPTCNEIPFHASDDFAASLAHRGREADTGGRIMPSVSLLNARLGVLANAAATSAVGMRLAHPPAAAAGARTEQALKQGGHG